MPEIKTRDVIGGTIKSVDRTALAGQRMKDAYIQTKRKAEHSVYSSESSSEEYASDRLEAGMENQLTQLEKEKEILDFQIQEEKRNETKNDLDEGAILEAFRKAQQMFHSRELPQMEQIINLYLDRVIVYPEYVEIHLNSVPNNLISSSQPKDEPALGGLHTFCVEKMCSNVLQKSQTEKKEHYSTEILVKLHRKEENKNESNQKSKKKPKPKSAWAWVNLVEMRGIEPLSESNLERTSPGAVCYLHSLFPTETNILRESVAS